MTTRVHLADESVLEWGVNEGKILVCLHGLGDRKEAFRHFAPLMVRRGHRVLAMDAPGHGDSVRPPPRCAQDVAEVLESVVEQVGSPCVLVAHSAGAAPAIAVTAARPDLVRSLVLIAPVLDRGPDGWVMKLASGTVMRFAPLWMLSTTGPCSPGSVRRT